MPASPLSEGTPSPGRPAFAPPEARSPPLLWGFMVASLPHHDRLNPWPLAAELSLQFRSAPQRSGVEVEMNPPPNDEAGSAGRQPRAPGLPAVMPSSDHDAPQPPRPTGSPEGSGAGNGDKTTCIFPVINQSVTTYMAQ